MAEEKVSKKRSMDRKVKSKAKPYQYVSVNAETSGYKKQTSGGKGTKKKNQSPAGYTYVNSKSTLQMGIKKKSKRTSPMLPS